MTATADATCEADATAARKARDVPVPAGFDLRDRLSGLGAHLAGPANVVMQLARPGVGYGVMNSRVDSGNAAKRPFKRGRTTFTYLAVSMLGTDEERAAFRKEINGAHAQVYSRADEPVEYRAMDPRLQKWVAACLYYGTVDLIEKMHGHLPEAEADALYAHGARFGTSLQMTAADWPADRAAFAAYWEESLAEVRIDAPVAAHLLHLVQFKNFPRPFHVLGPFFVFVTTGFLPPVFREAMSLPWNDRQQRRFDRLMRLLGRIEDALPRAVRNFPFNYYLLDFRIRRRLGRPVL
ncbi:oxygenase MpaB family protein [Nocardioides sp. YIM 152588]|uniref:oxygenase MpaB family protein n=1 Tax=Nocardioides sp. YIM 152588 TaxID=3158259 RepID=UPI0032E51A4B